MMGAQRVSTQEAKAKLSEYLNRAHYQGERFIIERHGKPMAAIVSPDDLTALEGQSRPSPDEAYRKALEEMGIVISWPSGKGISAEERMRELIHLEGKPLSQQIIEDRG
jgi:prevent-host-death family protein